MKKLILPLVAVLFCMASCQKENGILYLVTENYTGDAKLHLDNESYAVWDNGDEVKVNGTKYTVSVGSGTATITGVPGASNYTAIYPASWANNTSIKYPAEQTYRKNTSTGLQVIDAPMAAYSDGGTLAFHNLGSILAVEVTNSSSETMSVQKIEVVSASGVINGTFSIQDIATAPSLGSVSGGSTTTTLKCNGESIAAGNTQTFYIAMPPVERKLTIKVYDQYYTYTKTQASAHTMAANHGYTAAIATSDSPVQFAPKANQIIYTASSKLSEYEEGSDYNFFYMNVTSHTFSNGQGIISFENSFTSIPYSAFEYQDNLQSVILSSNVTSIEDYAFTDCENLSSVKAPNVTTIGESAFYYCYNLSSIEAPNVTTIGERAFYSCSSYGISFNFPNLTTIGNGAFEGCNICGFNFSNVNTIGDAAFSAVGFETDVDLSNVASIGNSAFEYAMIEKITIPVSPSSLGSGIFSSASIRELYFNSTSAPSTIYNDVFNELYGKDYIMVHLPGDTPDYVKDYWVNVLGFSEENIWTF